MLVRHLESETDPLAIASKPLYVPAGTGQNRKGDNIHEFVQPESRQIITALSLYGS